MPHYYFHLRDRDSILRDEAGLTLPDPEAAWYQAARSASALIRAQPDVRSAWADRAIEIADEEGEAIDQLPLATMARYAV